MLERIGIFQVVFAQSDAMYKDPTQAALMQWRVWHGAPVDSTIDDEKAAVDEVVQRPDHPLCPRVQGSACLAKLRGPRDRLPGGRDDPL
jgi:hypothetical protein